MASPKTISSKVLFCFVGCILGLGLSEVLLKTSISAPQLFAGRRSASAIRYNPSVGWLPLADGVNYSTQGIYLPKTHFRPGKQRIIFLGDSVAAGGYISDAFDRAAKGNVEVLNAGVPGYETHQETFFFENQVRKTNPSIVILLFHPNDFDIGVSAVQDDAGTLKVANSFGDSLSADPSLFWHSTVYQFFLQSMLRLSARRFSQTETIEQSLARLSQLSSSDGFQFLVVMLPWFKWQETWSDAELARRSAILGMLNKLGLCFIDGYEVLPTASGQMGSIRATNDDIHHPSLEFADLLARYIYERSFQTTENSLHSLTLNRAAVCPGK